MLVLAFIAISLIFIGTFTTWLAPLQVQFAEVSRPFHWLANVPARLADWGEDAVLGRADLEAENNRLRTELLVNKARAQRLAGLSAENIRLRNLLNATELLLDRVLVTELIGASPDPSRQTILINRGARDDLSIGQAVLDADGLMGQVTEVYEQHSRVLLITDARHALPVQVVRNGVRSIAEGIGDYGRLRLRHVTPTMDIEVGDELVSSGLGGRYPSNYPVGRVVSVKKLDEDSYLQVIVEPKANINRSRHLLLIFSETERLGE